MTENRLDEDNLAAYSAARRAADEKGKLLADLIEGYRARRADATAVMTRQDLAAELAGYGRTVPASRPKAELAAEYVKAATLNSDASREWETLRLAAAYDAEVVRLINAALDQAEEILVQYRGELDQAAGKAPRYVQHMMVVRSDDVFLAQWEAHYAYEVVRLVRDKDLDLRDAVMKVAGEAMFTVMSFARHVWRNGTGDTRQLEDTAEAVGATNFVSRIASAIIGDSVPASWVTR